MENNTPNKKKNIVLLIIACVIVILLVGIISYLCIPAFLSLSDPEVQAKFRAWISSFGVGGWFIMLGLQILQVVLAFIPGEPVQLLSGVLYGTWGGMFTCLLGSFIASLAIFKLVSKLGNKILLVFFSEEKISEFSFLKDSERIETVTFILFLIPGMPKDLLTYIAGVSKINIWKFLAISTTARIPALAVSTLLGSSASRGNWEITIALVIGAIIFAFIGVIYRARIMHFIRGHKHKS